MHTSTILLSALAATLALAQTTPAPTSNQLRIRLINASATVDSILLTQVFAENELPGRAISVPNTFDTLIYDLGPDVADKTQRCQLRDEAGEVVRVNRGNNTEKSTFSAGNPWTFSFGPSLVREIICPVEAPDGE